MIRNFDQWIKSTTKEERPNPISAMVGEIREDFRAELNCPSEEELCGYVDGTLAQVDPKRNLAIENHLLGTIGHRPCILCKRDVWELCEVLGIISEKLVQDLLKQETPNPDFISIFISLLRDEREKIRIEAAKAMQEWGKRYRKPHHVRWLLPLRNDEKWQVRGNAAILIGDLGRPFDTIWLKPLLDDEHPTVWQYADNAMEKLGYYIPYQLKDGKIVQIHQATKGRARWQKPEDAPRGPAENPEDGQPVEQAMVARLGGRVIQLGRIEAPADLELSPYTHIMFGDKLFSLGLEFQNELDKGSISTKLRQEFKNNGISLSENTTIKESNNEWLIADAHKAYSVRKQKGQLYVYSDKFGVALYVFPTSDGRRFALSAVIRETQGHSEKPISDVAVRIVEEDGTLGNEKETKNGTVYIGAREPGRYVIQFKHADITRHIIVDLKKEDNNV